MNTVTIQNVGSLSHNNVTLLQASKGKTSLAAARDQVHTQQITKNC